MELLVLLSVLAIAHTHVIARSADIKDNGSGTNDRSDKVVSESIPEIVFRLPTSLKDGYRVTINGTINTAHKMLTAILPALSGLDHEHCRFVYDFEKQLIKVSPSPFEVESSDSYQIFHKDGELSKFSLNILANKNEQYMFKLAFETNDDGESSSLYCKIDNFDNFDHIIIKEGVHNITSLLFEFL